MAVSPRRVLAENIAGHLQETCSGSFSREGLDKLRIGLMRMSVSELEAMYEMMTGIPPTEKPERIGPGTIRPGQEEMVHNREAEKEREAMRIQALMREPGVEHIDIRVFLRGSEYETEGDALDAIYAGLKDHPSMSGMICAYQLKNEGFGHLTPDLSGPLS